MIIYIIIIDPLGRPTIKVSSDHSFHTCRPSIPTFHYRQSNFQVKTVTATGRTVGLTEGISDDYCLVLKHAISVSRKTTSPDRKDHSFEENRKLFRER